MPGAVGSLLPLGRAWDGSSRAGVPVGEDAGGRSLSSCVKVLERCRRGLWVAAACGSLVRREVPKAAIA